MRMFTVTLVMLIALPLNSILAQEKSINISRVPRQDCTALELDRNSSAETYAAYGSCVVNNSFVVFVAVYTRHLRDFPNETQDIVVRFKVNVDGSVSDPVASAVGVTDSQYLLKVAARLRLVEFLPSANGAQEITHTFKFAQYRS